MNSLCKNIFDYDIYIFDCDGVILDSNNFKAKAFYDSVLEFGEDKANKFLEYHKQNGGISRYDKFKYFFSKIHKAEEINLSIYISRYEKLISSEYKNSKIVDGFMEFISMLRNKECYIVSASDEKELKEVLKYRNIDRYFKDIYGSPKNKIENIKKFISYKNKKVIFIGDSQTDLEASDCFNFDFLFLSGYCEVDLAVDLKIKNFQELV